MESEETSAESALSLGQGPTDAPTAVGYVRLSQESDRSIPAQKEDIRTYCKQHGFELAGILSDGERSSGFDDDRAQYQELRRLISGQAVDAIVVRDLSRLSRNRNARIRLLLDLDETPVELHTAERGHVESAEYDLALETMRATADDVEKRKEIERSKRETHRRVESGYHHGRPPFGFAFDKEGKHLVPGEEFETALDVLDLRDGGASYREIAKRTGVAKSTVARVVNNRQRYEEVI